MSLKIELKPRECIIIGDALITNDNDRVRFYIDGNVPILREEAVAAMTLAPEYNETNVEKVYSFVLDTEIPDYSEGFDELFFVSISECGYKIDEWRSE